jgi:hypothetical protein
MSTPPEFFITPRVPGVRPQDPPNYDGYVFVYVFTQVLDPWVMPPVLGNVTLVVANAQGFVPGMTIMIEFGGYFEVVSTDALNRMTVLNFGNYNQPPGTSIPPGKITTTSLPGPSGPPGPTGAQGALGPAGIQGIPGPPLQVKGSVAGTGNLPMTGNTNGDLYTVTSNGHGYAWSGTAWIDLGPFQGPTGPGAYTFLNAGFTVPAVGSSVTVAVADSSWVALGEVLYVQDAGGPGVAGPMQVIGKTPSSVTLLNIGTSSGIGPPGPAGANGASAFTLSNSGFTIPPYGQSVTIPVANTDWVALGEILYVQDAGGPGIAGLMQVTGKTATTLTLLNLAGTSGVGPPGPTGPPAYTNSTTGFSVPAVGSAIVVPVADSSWVAPGEIVYVQDAGGPGIAGAMQVTAKTPTSLTLQNI